MAAAGNLLDVFRCFGFMNYSSVTVMVGSYRGDTTGAADTFVPRVVVDHNYLPWGDENGAEPSSSPATVKAGRGTRQFKTKPWGCTGAW